ncbi:putative AC transposase [Beauveria bassiana]|nr:putative AC transposase [Beauveria bassiana]
MASETELFSSSPPPNPSGTFERFELASLSSARSSPATSLPATPSPRPRGTATDFIKVDWTLWGRQEWAKWPGFERYTGGQDTRAWWQAYGYRVEDNSTSRQGNKLKWICADYFARSFKQKSDFCFICSTGVSVKKHLRDAHGIQAPNDAACRRGGLLLQNQTIARFAGADFENPGDQFLMSKLRGQFNVKGLRMLLLDWITYHNLPFETVNAERFQRILLYGNPLLDSALLPSAKTLLRMLESDVRAMLYGSKGENLAAIVSADGDDDEDEDEVDRAIDEALRGEMLNDEIGFELDALEPIEDCYSSHPAPEEITNATFREFSLHGAPGMLHNIGLQLRASPQLYEQFLQSQRKESGKSSTLHWVFNNATRWVSDKRMMERALILLPALNIFFNDVQNRWESESGSERTKPVVLKYRLSPYDWKVVEILVKLLKPFEVATKQLQGSGMPGTRSTCGSFDEYFPVIEILLDHLESAIEGTVYEELKDPGTKERKDIETAIFEGLDSRTRKLLKVFIKLGWKKLHKYYDLLTSAAYVGAVVFNPTKKWRLLDLLWSRVPSRKAKSWRQDYKHKLLQIWERYKDREVDCEVVPTPEDVSMDYIERRLARSVAGSALFRSPSTTAISFRKGNNKTKQMAAGTAIDDEYARYCAEDVVNSPHYRCRPIDWWKINVGRYPRLSMLAIDMLSIPSSSAESERTFSSAGRMTGPLRNRLRREIVAMAQCIRLWSAAGIYSPSLPLLNLDDSQWVDALASLKGSE